MSGLSGGNKFAGTGAFSLDVTGAGNLNGNAVIDGSFANGKQSDDRVADIQSHTDDEIRTDYNGGEEMDNGNENFGRGSSIDDIALHQFGNVNSQADIHQYGMANSNKQGGIMQQAYRRQKNSIHQQPNQHLVCGYRYKTIYPDIQLQRSHVESDAIESDLRNADDQSLAGQYTMQRRFYSGPFNHLL